MTDRGRPDGSPPAQPLPGDDAEWAFREAAFAAELVADLESTIGALRRTDDHATSDTSDDTSTTPDLPDPTRGADVRHDLDTASRLWDAYNEARAATGPDRAEWRSHPLVCAHIDARLGMPVPEWTAARLPEHARIAAIGCGAGEFEADVAALAEPAEVHLFDIAESSLRTAGARVRAAAPRTTVHTHAQTIRAGSLPDGLDAVVFHHSLHHIAALEEVLDEATRALRPDGCCIAVEYVGPDRFAFPPAHTRWPQRLHRALDPGLRRPNPDLPLPDPVAVAEVDPTEAVRAAELHDAIATRFVDVERVSVGGALAHVLWYGLDHDACHDTPEGIEFVSLLLELDAALVDSGRLPSYFDVTCARTASFGLDDRAPASGQDSGDRTVSRLEAELTLARAEIGVLRQALRENRAARLRAEEIVETGLRPLIDDLVADRNAAAARVDELLSSTSWRVTAPLRRLRGD